MSGHVPLAFGAMRMTIAHMLLEVVLSFEHLMLVVICADIAGVTTVRVCCTMPQKGVTSRVSLAAPEFLTSPSFVLRAHGVPVETLEVVKVASTL